MFSALLLCRGALQRIPLNLSSRPERQRLLLTRSGGTSLHPSLSSLFPLLVYNPPAITSMVYHIYIMASASGVLYTGVTSHLEARVAQHKQKLFAGFSAQYNTTKLVYFEPFSDVRNAIAREKQLKRWRREKKVFLIERANPAWRDLSADFPR